MLERVSWEDSRTAKTYKRMIADFPRFPTFPSFHHTLALINVHDHDSVHTRCPIVYDNPDKATYDYLLVIYLLSVWLFFLLHTFIKIPGVMFRRLCKSDINSSNYQLHSGCARIVRKSTKCPWKISINMSNSNQRMDQ